MAVSESNKALARYLCSILGGVPKVTKYWDASQTSSVDIMSVDGVPGEGLTTCVTLGLSDSPSDLQVAGIPLGVELLMAAESRYDTSPNVLATCAFNVINSGMQCRPGRVFPGVVQMYRPGGAMQHILFLPPFPWELQTRDFPEKKVVWLLAVPISEREYAMVQTEGSDSLEDVFERRNIDVFDLDRDSAV